MKRGCLHGLLLGVIAFASAGQTVAANAVMVGNSPGQSQIAQGPVGARIDMTPCRFSMTLAQDQWLQFNSPDLVFVAAKHVPKSSSVPRLLQAPIPSGYEWSFEKRADLSQPWFGVVCENAASFSALTTKPPTDDTIERQLVRESNDLKCPATLTDHGWAPNSLAGPASTYTFEPLSGEKSSGFIFAFHDKSRRHITRVAFCMLHGENVLIGSAQSGSSTPLAISAEGFEQLKTAVRSITFE